MKQVRFHEFGEPQATLCLEEAPAPLIPPRHVAVRLRLRPVNPSDLYQIRGKYGRLPELPATAGLEGMGVVADIGAGVDPSWLGARVVFTQIQGSWAECVVLPEDALIRVPEGVPDEAAAQAMVNPLTAHLMIQELAPPPGSWVVATAPASAVGHGLLDLARHQGFQVLALVRHERHRAALEARGATVLCTQDPDWLAQGRHRVGQGAHAILDAVGGPQAADVFSLMRPGGTHLVYGALSLKPLQIPGGQIIYRHATVRGFMVFAWKQAAGPEGLRKAMDAVFQHQREGRLCPPVEASYDLASFRDAVMHAERPERSGKILLESQLL